MAAAFDVFMVSMMILLLLAIVMAMLELVRWDK